MLIWLSAHVALSALAASLAAAGAAQQSPTAASADPPHRAAEETVKSPRIADVSAACGGELSRDDFMKLDAAKRRAKLRCYVRHISKLLNQKLPTRIEYTTVLSRTTVTGVTMTYHFRADVEARELKPGEMKAWMPTVRANICDDPGMREIVSLGGIYRYIWLDHDGKYIDTLVVRDCPK